jgi:integrase/recombinase XerD
MVVLMSIYGLRSGEIRALRVADADFENRILNVRRGKSDHTQRFPMNSILRASLKSYLLRIRPKSNHPALFISFSPPYRPITRATLHGRVRRLFKANRVKSTTMGPHALRHACAARLMIQGASVKSIASFLGQHDTRSVREYTRYDTSGLRQVADFSLSGLMWESISALRFMSRRKKIAAIDTIQLRSSFADLLTLRADWISRS